MRRRTRDVDDSARVPAHLRRYDPADWPDPSCHPECAYWEAVGEWRERHPLDLDTDGGHPEDLVAADGPDVPFHPKWLGDRIVDAAHDEIV